MKILAPFRGAQSHRLTLEGVDDGEDVDGDKGEHTRGEGEEDQCPGDAQQDAQPKEGQHMLELVAFFVLPEDLPYHGPQHDRVKEEHQAEETQVHGVVDQGVRDPASGGRRKGRGLHCVLPQGQEEAQGEAQQGGASPALREGDPPEQNPRKAPGHGEGSAS